MWEPTTQDIENLGSNNLFKMFCLTKKNEITKYAAGITITGRELVDTIIGCHHIGYQYYRQTHYWAPEHLNPEDEEIFALGNADTSQETIALQEKFFRKVNQGFKERKLLIFHLFVRDPAWHVIYFNEKDSDIRRNNHWMHGEHIHFINHLWGVDIESIWNNFPTLPGNSLHIKYDGSGPGTVYLIV